MRALKPKKGTKRSARLPGTGGRRLINVNKSWAHLAEQAERSDFRFHDLRHQFASNSLMGGVDLKGHQDWEQGVNARAEIRVTREDATRIVATTSEPELAH